MSTKQKQKQMKAMTTQRAECTYCGGNFYNERERMLHEAHAHPNLAKARCPRCQGKLTERSRGASGSVIKCMDCGFVTSPLRDAKGRALKKLSEGASSDIPRYSKPGWYVAQDRGFPHRQSCIMCPDDVRAGEIVYAQDYKKDVNGDGLTETIVVVFHRRCIEQKLSFAPQDDYDVIRSRLASGGPLFTEGR